MFRQGIRRRLGLILSCGMLATLVSCGSSSTVEYYPLTMAFSPASPIVISVPFKRKTGKKDEAGNELTEDVPASWFQVGVKFTNSGTRTITLQSLVFVVTLPLDVGAGSGTGTTTTPADPTAGGGSTAGAPTDASTARCEFVADPVDKVNNPAGKTYLAELAPGASYKQDFLCKGLELKTVFVAPVEVSVQGWTGPASGSAGTIADIGRLNVAPATFTTQ